MDITIEDVGTPAEPHDNPHLQKSEDTQQREQPQPEDLGWMPGHFIPGT